MVLFSDSAFAAVYYLNPAQGNDANPGTSGSPWKTMRKVKTTVAAGDTVNIVGGTYTQSQVEPDAGTPAWTETHSHGTAGHPITIRATPGSKVVFDGQFKVYWQFFTPRNGASPRTARYVVIQDLEFRNYTTAVVGSRATSHVAVVNCFIHDIYDQTSGALTSSNADHLIYRNNRIFNEGDPSRGFNGSGDHGIYVSDNSESIVAEGNTIEKTAGFGIHLWNSHGVPNTTRNVILRKNTIINNAASGITVAGLTYQNIYIYNNTIYEEPVPYAAIHNSAGNDTVTFHNGGTFSHIRILNNIGYGYSARASFSQDNHADFTSLILDYNLWTNLTNSARTIKWDSTFYTLASYRAATGQDAHAITGDPRFVNAAGRDFTLQATSPGINTGTFLTTTVGPGSGTILRVADAGYFMDGFGLVTGDMIQVGSNSPVQITSINYGTNAITVARSISWTNGQGVSLPYSGARPDMGARPG